MRLHMQVIDIIPSLYETVTPNDKIRVIKEVYAQKKIAHLMVVEENKLVGIVSIEDLYGFITGHWNDNSGTQLADVGLESKISSIMNTKIRTLNGRDCVAKAINTLCSTKLPCLPVVDDLNEPLGLLTYADIIQYLDSRLVVKVPRRIA